MQSGSSSVLWVLVGRTISSIHPTAVTEAGIQPAFTDVEALRCSAISPCRLPFQCSTARCSPASASITLPGCWRPPESLLLRYSNQDTEHELGA